MEVLEEEPGFGAWGGGRWEGGIEVSAENGVRGGETCEAEVIDWGVWSGNCYWGGRKKDGFFDIGGGEGC